MPLLPTKDNETGLSSICGAFLSNELTLKRFLRRFLYKPEDIDDIAQETFLRAYRATKGREIDSPKAYLFQVARMLAFHELSRKTRTLTHYLEEAIEEDMVSSSSLEEELLAQQKIELYLEAIADLPPQCRRVFLMRKVQGLSYKAIAARTGVGISAVEKHIARGVERCKKFMDNKEQALQIKESLANDGNAQHSGQSHE